MGLRPVFEPRRLIRASSFKRSQQYPSSTSPSRWSPFPRWGRRELPELGATLLRWEGAPDTEFFRQITWAHLIELPLRGDPHPRRRGRAARGGRDQRPRGALNERRKAGLVDEATADVLEATGWGDDAALRVWVLINEVPEGNWGAGKQIIHFEQLREAAKAERERPRRPPRSARRSAVRQLTYIEKDRLEWREASEPRIEAEGEALVRPVAVATCDLDLWMVRGRRALPGRSRPGTRRGRGDRHRRRGVHRRARPAGQHPFQISCGECATCARGHTGNCERVGAWPPTGCRSARTTAASSATPSRCRSPTGCCWRSPTGSSRPRSRACPTTSPMPGAPVGPQPEAQPGAEVLVCGAPARSASTAVAIAVALGAGRVDFAGGGPEHRALAEELGRPCSREGVPERLGPYPIAVDFSATPRAGLRAALDGARWDLHDQRDLPEPETPVPLLEMYTKGIHVSTGRVTRGRRWSRCWTWCRRPGRAAGDHGRDRGVGRGRRGRRRPRGKLVISR